MIERMKVALLTTLPNNVVTTLGNMLGSNLYVLDIAKIVNKKDAIMKMIQEHTPDTLITYRCPYVLHDDVLATLPLGAYNIHPSLLPKYKGLNPWEDIFRNHEVESGVTLHRITKEVDNGTIVSQKAFIITPSDTIKSARAKADELAAMLAKEFVYKLLSNVELWSLPNKFDYQESIISRENLLFLKGSDNVEYNGMYREGAFCIVFQLRINGEEYAIRCWKCLNEKSKIRICRRMRLVSDWIKTAQPLYLYEILLYANGIKTIKGIYPIAIMKWKDDVSLKEYLRLNIQDSISLQKLSDSFVAMVSYLHTLHIAHGDINMDNIRVKEDGSLYLIDYDTFYVPTMEYEEDDVKGKAEYQHHMRNNNVYLSEYIDYYSEYIIYLTINVFARYPEAWSVFDFTNKDSHIFNKNELQDIRNSRIYSFVRDKNDEKLLKVILYLDEMWQANNTLSSLDPIEDRLKMGCISLDSPLY